MLFSTVHERILIHAGEGSLFLQVMLFCKDHVLTDAFGIPSDSTRLVLPLGMLKQIQMKIDDDME